MANEVFGITGTAVLDRSTNRVYFVGKAGVVYARDMSTGTPVAGWPVRITSDQDTNTSGAGLPCGQGTCSS